MIGKLARIGVVGWLATKAYKQIVDKPKVAADQLVEHMEVVGADGGHVGTVDHLSIKLTRTDPAAGGKHHLVPFSKAAAVRDGKLVLTLSTAEALATLKTVSD